MKVAVASPPFPKSINDGLYWLEKLIKEAAAKDADVICFPESFIPGYPLEECEIEDSSPEKLQAALDKASIIAAENNVAIILPMDWYDDDRLYNIAHVISRNGSVLGYQSKTQLDPSEDNIWAAGKERRVFELDGVKLGVTICHEGFRYPESVRWSATNGAQIVFHPHCAGSNVDGPQLTEWGHKDNPYYEKAMMMRALENTIYFASSNYASLFPDSASALIAPDGKCVAHAVYGQPGVFVTEVDLEKATGLLAKRFKPENYY
jgi:predicted amidohydrolase